MNMQPDMSIIAEAANGKEAVELTLEHEPDIVLMDISMPVLDGVEATQQISENLPETGIIILTMHKRDDYVFEAIKAGAKGYLLKEVEMDELLRAVRTVAEGEAILDPILANKVLDEFRPRNEEDKPLLDELAERDIEILSLLSHGLTNQEIADQLTISEKTVRNRLTMVFKQLHLKNRTEAALYAMRKGLS